MKAIPVSLALAVVISAGPAYADTIDFAAYNEPQGAIAELSARGINICPNLKHADLHNWDVRTGAPASFWTALDHDDWNYRQWSRFEGSFLADGTRAFGAYRSPLAIRAVFRGWHSGHRNNGRNEHGKKIKTKKDKKDKNHGHDGDCDDGLPGRGDDDPVATPEPGALLLLGTGLAAVARRVRKRRG